jgi:protein KRI1
MPKKVLDLDSGDELNELQINKAFSERYENYRSKEVMQRLKDKYGDQMWQSSEEGEDDDVNSDDDAESEDDTEQVEKEVYDETFLRVLGALKSKDAAIYDKSKRFYDDAKEATEDQVPNKSNAKSTSNDKPAKMDLVAYHTKLLKEKKGVTEEDEQLMQRTNEGDKGYYRELADIKKELISAANDDSDDDLIVGKRVEIPTADGIKTVDPKDFLSQKSKEDKHIGKLASFWNSDTLNEKDRFLRDYFMNKQFVVNSEDSDEDADTKDHGRSAHKEESEAEVDSDDETQRNLVKAYESTRFHHEEVDGVLIKSYPRNVESIRDIALKQKKSDKRAEQAERKKQQKEAELKKLRELKRDEIRKKIQMLEKTSGSKLGHKLKEIDLDMLVDDTEFDADKYDAKMAALFNDDFYGDADDNEKPKFEYDSDIDDCEYEQIGDQGLLAVRLNLFRFYLYLF